MRYVLAFLLCSVVLFVGVWAVNAEEGEEIPLSEETEECLGCHEVYSPGKTQ